MMADPKPADRLDDTADMSAVTEDGSVQAYVELSIVEVPLISFGKGAA